MISQKAKYAFHALIALARADDTLLAREIADQENIPQKFLEQILLDLKRHGILQSRRGRSGGYALLEPANRITFGKVLRIVDGPVAPLPCLSRILSAMPGLWPGRGLRDQARLRQGCRSRAGRARPHHDRRRDQR